MFGSQTDRGGPGPRPTAVEVHSLPADVSLRQLRDLISQGSPGQVLQCIAALDSSEQGVALIILSSEASAARVVELFDGYPLGGAYLHVKRADSLPGSLVNLLYSLEQAPSPAETAAAQATAAAAYLEQQQLLQHAEKRRVQQAQQEVQQAWDAAQRQQQQQRDAAASAWSTFDRPPSQPNGLPPTNGHSHAQQNGGSGSYAQRPSQPSQQQQLESDLQQLQLEQQQQRQQQKAVPAAAAVGLPPLQPAPQQPQPQQRPGAMSWASAAAAAPSLAALAARPQTVAAALAAAGSAAGSGSGPSSDDWQAAGSRGRSGRRDGQAGAAGGRAGSSVSSGSPRPTARSTGRRSDDKPSRPGGQDGASPEPTTKLWMGGIDGTASAETVRAVFGRFGPIYDYELQPATHEKGRTDQWGFVNFKRLGDATRAYQALVGEVIPELTGTRKLKLQFRPVDSRRSATGAGSRR